MRKNVHIWVPHCMKRVCWNASPNFCLNKSPGTDNLHCKLLRITDKYTLHTPLCHIFNMCLEHGVCLEIRKGFTDSSSALTSQNSCHISLLPVLSKLWEKIVSGQIQKWCLKKQYDNKLPACTWKRAFYKFQSHLFEPPWIAFFCLL